MKKTILFIALSLAFQIFAKQVIHPTLNTPMNYELKEPWQIYWQAIPPVVLHENVSSSNTYGAADYYDEEHNMSTNTLPFSRQAMSAFYGFLDGIDLRRSEGNDRLPQIQFNDFWFKHHGDMTNRQEKLKNCRFDGCVRIEGEDRSVYWASRYFKNFLSEKGVIYPGFSDTDWISEEDLWDNISIYWWATYSVFHPDYKVYFGPTWTTFLEGGLLRKVMKGVKYDNYEAINLGIRQVTIDDFLKWAFSIDYGQDDTITLCHPEYIDLTSNDILDRKPLCTVGQAISLYDKSYYENKTITLVQTNTIVNIKLEYDLIGKGVINVKNDGTCDVVDDSSYLQVRGFVKETVTETNVYEQVNDLKIVCSQTEIRSPTGWGHVPTGITFKWDASDTKEQLDWLFRDGVTEGEILFRVDTGFLARLYDGGDYTEQVWVVCHDDGELTKGIVEIPLEGSCSTVFYVHTNHYHHPFSEQAYNFQKYPNFNDAYVDEKYFYISTGVHANGMVKTNNTEWIPARKDEYKFESQDYKEQKDIRKWFYDPEIPKDRNNEIFQKLREMITEVRQTEFNPQNWAITSGFTADKVYDCMTNMHFTASMALPSDPHYYRRTVKKEGDEWNFVPPSQPYYWEFQASGYGETLNKASTAQAFTHMMHEVLWKLPVSEKKASR